MRISAASVTALFAITVAAAAVNGEDNGLTNIVDLSVDLVHDYEAIASSPGSAAVNETASSDPLIRTALVLEKGKVVAKYIREDVDESTPNQAWSVTKSWVSLLIGMLVESDLLSLNETLGDIFTDSEAWGGVIDEETIDFRKNVTIEDMLTMSSGLIDPPLPDEVMDPSFVMTDEMLEADFAAGQVGGANLTHSLGLPNIGTKGEFSYLAASNIMSYVIQTRSGLSPREYLSANVMQKLNIGEDEYGWEQNADGVELGYHGLELTPLQMAKFGQLYLQEGQYKEDNYLVSKSWVEDSLTTHAVNPETQSGYGYLFWNIGPYSCAMGFLGQDICIDPNTERVVVQQRDADYENILAGNYIMTPIALDPSLSFDSSDETIAESPTISEETVAESPTVAPTKGVIQTDGPTSASSSGTSLTVLQMTSLCIALLIAKFL